MRLLQVPGLKQPTIAQHRSPKTKTVVLIGGRRARHPRRAALGLRLLRPGWCSGNPTVCATAEQSDAADLDWDAEDFNPESDTRFQRNFWAAVDACGWLGSVAGAAAFVLTQELWLMALPVALPAVAILASRQKERLAAQEATQRYSAAAAKQYARTACELQQLALGLRQEVGQQVSRELSAARADLAQLKSIEAKLAAIEGSMISTGRAARDAAAASSGAAAREAALAMSELRGALAADVRRELAARPGPGAANPAPALARLEARLSALEGGLASLEASQAQSLRSLAGSLTAAVRDAEAGTAALVRSEIFSAGEPLRRLPALLEAARGAGALATPGGGMVQQLALAEARIAEVVGIEVRAAVGEAVAALPQAAARGGGADGDGVAEGAMSPAQWAALGKRLSGIEAQLQELASGQAGAATADSAALLAQQLSEVREAVSGALQLQQQAAASNAGSDEAAVAAAVSAAVDEVRATLQGAAAEAAAAAALEPVRNVVLQVSEGVEELRQAADGVAAAGAALAGAVGAVDEVGAALGEVRSALGALGLAAERGQALTSAQLAEALAPVEAAVARLADEVGGQQAASAGGNGGAAGSSGAGALLEGEARTLGAADQGRQGSTAAPGGGSNGSNGAQPVPPRSGGARGESRVERGDAAASSDDAYQRMQALLAAKRADASGSAAQVATTTIDDTANGMGPPALLSGGEGEGPGIPFQSWLDRGASAGAPRDALGAMRARAAPLPDQVAFAAAAGAAAPAGAAGADAPGASVGGEAVEGGPGLSDGGGGELDRGADNGAAGGSGGGGVTAGDADTGVRYGGTVARGGEAGALQYDARASGDEAYYGGGAAPPYYGRDGREAAAGAVEAAGGPPFGGGADSERAPAAAHSVEEGAGEAAEGAGEPADEASTLLRAGLDLLRQGRGQARAPDGDFGRADELLRSAQDCFARVAALQPDNVTALGNWGNALLAHGETKRRMLAELPAPPPGSASGAAASESSRALVREAEALLVAAGRRFRSVLAVNDGDVRALTNWGKALCLRANLTDDQEAAAKLFAAAVQKFELALDIQPGFLPATRDAGLALRDLALCQPPGSGEAWGLLRDAAGYLQAAAEANPGDTGVAALLREVEEELAQSGIY